MWSGVWRAYCSCIPAEEVRGSLKKVLGLGQNSRIAGLGFERW